MNARHIIAASLLAYSMTGQAQTWPDPDRYGACIPGTDICWPWVYFLPFPTDAVTFDKPDNDNAGNDGGDQGNAPDGPSASPANDGASPGDSGQGQGGPSCGRDS